MSVHRGKQSSNYTNKKYTINPTSRTLFFAMTYTYCSYLLHLFYLDNSNNYVSIYTIGLYRRTEQDITLPVYTGKKAFEKIEKTVKPVNSVFFSSHIFTTFVTFHQFGLHLLPI